MHAPVQLRRASVAARFSLEREALCDRIATNRNELLGLKRRLYRCATPPAAPALHCQLMQSASVQLGRLRTRMATPNPAPLGTPAVSPPPLDSILAARGRLLRG